MKISELALKSKVLFLLLFPVSREKAINCLNEESEVR